MLRLFVDFKYPPNIKSVPSEAQVPKIEQQLFDPKKKLFCRFIFSEENVPAVRFFGKYYFVGTRYYANNFKVFY